ncbi:MAG TPA: SusD/RagB family nutrient-binding outer membrane lipoprotein [Mucilaginibacter sp.]|nr:SusD/RagB family nutrient-binding outer membrane lipoprotein [Mucilaginibacter sp.]
MKRKAIILVLVSILSACTKDLQNLNVDPKHPLTVPSYSLFTNAQHALANTLTSSNVNLNIFRLIEQQWEETTYTDESNYNLKSRAIPDNIWDGLYTNVLANLEQSKKTIPTDVTDPVQQKNELAIADIMEVYTYFYLVTTYGNVPYTQALDIKQPFPKFDDAKTIYYDLLTRLDNDIATLNANASGASFGSADLIYNGDPVKWQKFANTFKLKMGIVISDSDPAKATSVITSAMTAGIFTSNADNAVFKYLAQTPNTNPIWVDLVQSGRQDFVANSTIIGYLQPTGFAADPRLPYYFTVNNQGTYTGGDPGANCSFGGNSKPSGPLLVPSSIGLITNPDFPGDLLDYAETQFYLAEAVAKNLIGGSAATYYTNGILASEEFWGVPTVNATAYLAQPNVAFATATAPDGTALTLLQKIALQGYLALYNRGWDAWIFTRVLDYPVFPAPESALSDFPARFTYPINEQNVNVTNYNQAASAIGGDVVTTKLFFDKN